MSRCRCAGSRDGFTGIDFPIKSLHIPSQLPYFNGAVIAAQCARDRYGFGVV